jgi:serine/threonine protein phosphatase PrpC
MLRVAENVARTDTGRQRSGNEDSAYARAPLFVVADGMGGARGGEIASQLAVAAFERGLEGGGSLEERLKARVREANAEIYERALQEHGLSGMGTTLTAAYLDDAQVVVAHVGDSRAYLFRDGRLRRVTEDHSLVEELRRQGKLTEEQAAEHPQRSIITRALGPEPTVEVDTFRCPARAGDVLLLCSDGLTSMVAEERIAAILADAGGLDAAADALIREANAAGGRDNITVVLFRVEEVGGAVEQPTEIAPQRAAPRGTGAAMRTGTGAAMRTGTDAGAAAPAGAAGYSGGGHGSPTATVARPSVGLTGGKTPPAAPRHPGSPRLAHTQRRPAGAPPAPRRRSERFVKTASALTALVIVLALVGGGGYLASRQLYFIGTDAQGIVTIYRGFPYQLPLGIKLYETYYQSGVPAALVPADRRAVFFSDDLLSQTRAQNLVMDLERGQISK